MVGACPFAEVTNGTRVEGDSFAAQLVQLANAEDNLGAVNSGAENTKLSLLAPHHRQVSLSCSGGGTDVSDGSSLRDNKVGAYDRGDKAREDDAALDSAHRLGAGRKEGHDELRMTQRRLPRITHSFPKQTCRQVRTTASGSPIPNVPDEVTSVFALHSPPTTPPMTGTLLPTEKPLTDEAATATRTRREISLFMAKFCMLGYCCELRRRILLVVRVFGVYFTAKNRKNTNGEDVEKPRKLVVITLAYSVAAVLLLL